MTNGLNLVTSIVVLGNMNGIVFDSNGTYIYGSRGSTNTIIRINRETWFVEDYAGSSSNSGFRDGPLLYSRFYDPFGISIDQENNLYVGEYFNPALRKISTQSGQVNTIAGSSSGGYVDGFGYLSQFTQSLDIRTNDAGSLLIVADYNYIRQIQCISPYNMSL